jgi:hypothetical protein
MLSRPLRLLPPGYKVLFVFDLLRVSRHLGKFKDIVVGVTGVTVTATTMLPFA